MSRSKSNILALIPKDTSYKKSKIYNELSKIRGISIDMVKGMIFLSASDIKCRDEVREYLEKNKDLFRFTSESEEMFYGKKKMNIPTSKRKKALIIVDVQPVFLNDNNKHVLSNIAEIINTIPYDLYINAVFYTDKNSIWHKQTKWSVPKKEAKTESSIKKLLDEKENVVNVIKQTKSVFKGKRISSSCDWEKDCELLPFSDGMQINNIEEVHIIGLDTNDCVLATAYEAFDLGFFTYVIEECTQSSEGNEIHGKAIDLLRHVGLTNK